MSWEALDSGGYDQSQLLKDFPESSGKRMNPPTPSTDSSGQLSADVVLTKANVTTLVQVFITKVDPFIRIIHKPSFFRTLQHYLTAHCDVSGYLDLHCLHTPCTRTSGGNQSVCDMVTFRVLIFTVFYCAVVSLSETEFRATFPGSFVKRGFLSMTYREAIDAALAEADYLQREDLVILQALALYLGRGRPGQLGSLG
ncbi:hypothetical protein VTN77DRAFT_5050 [Rasamsonia byssochlamydoides]|uniref:uncharacterized protein n=1 Tax=Rasamsonia byssochlamydoides TaxID=89139 RepID=UPI0037442871